MICRSHQTFKGKINHSSLKNILYDFSINSDSLLELNSGASSNSNDSGLIIERGSTGNNAIFMWDESEDEFIVGTTTATADSTGNITHSKADFEAAKITGTQFELANTTTNDSLLITTTEDSSTAGPVVSLKRNSSSPADADYLGQIKFKGENVLAYWDDHVSQLDRIQFSIKNNIKYNIFDDDLSWSNMHSDGWPPLPTMNMLLFDYDKVNTNEKIEWISSNRKGEIFKKSIPTFDLKNNVENYSLFPELFEITGYQNRGQTSFLKLK